MSHNDQNQPQAWNSAVITYQSKDTETAGPYQVPPQQPITHDHKVPPSGEPKFKAKGDGFWRGCCAGLCCYCCLDICF